MPNGDYLWRVNDHAKTRREIARHSKVDAEAYEEYGKAMVEMGRFVKPILNMTPPDPDLARSARPDGSAVPRPPLPGALRPGQVQPGPADDHERRRFPRPVVRDRRAQGDDVGVGDHRHVPRRALARAPPTCCCTTTWARSTARFARGACRAAAPARSRTRSRERRAKRASRSGPRRRCRRSSSRTARPPASCSRTATTSPPTSSPRASIRVRPSSKMVGEEHLPAEFVEDVKRYKYRGSSGKVNMALDALPDFTCLPGAGPASSRRGLDLAERRLHGARLRRCEVWTVFAAPLHRHRDSEPDRSVGGAAGQARHVVLRAVRAVSPEGRHVGRTARGVRRHGREHASRNTRPTSRTSSCTARWSRRWISNASGV